VLCERSLAADKVLLLFTFWQFVGGSHMHVVQDCKPHWMLFVPECKCKKKVTHTLVELLQCVFIVPSKRVCKTNLCNFKVWNPCFWLVFAFLSWVWASNSEAFSHYLADNVNLCLWLSNEKGLFHAKIFTAKIPAWNTLFYLLFFFFFFFFFFFVFFYFFFLHVFWFLPTHCNINLKKKKKRLEIFISIFFPSFFQ
jgi:hypothetical protein